MLEKNILLLNIRTKILALYIILNCGIEKLVRKIFFIVIVTVFGYSSELIYLIVGVH